jgi:AraC-like DNA-binding protein
VSEQEEPIILGPGDLVLLPHGSAHTLAAATTTADPRRAPEVTPLTRLHDEPDTSMTPGSLVMLCGAYVLDHDRRHPLMGELPDVVHLPVRHGRHPALRTTVDLLGAELDRPAPGASALRSALLDALLVYMVRAWFVERSERSERSEQSERSEHHAPIGWGAALHDPAIASALDAVHTDPGKRWTVEMLAARARLSRATFSRRFTAAVAAPPMAYLAWWRMTLAARALRDSDAPLSVIARQVGYASEFAFANAFKREHGVAPGRFRNRSRDSREPAGGQSRSNGSG